MMGGEQRSDDTVLPPPSQVQYESQSFNTTNRYHGRGLQGIDPPLSSSTRLPPDRRSSIGATVKLRQSNPSAGSSGSSQPASPNPGKGKPDEKDLGLGEQHQEGKKSKLNPLRIFMRSGESHRGSGEPSPDLKSAESGFQHPAPAQHQGRPSHLNEAVTINEARATPPPIRRNRVGNGGAREGPYYRPSSAGAGQVRRVGALTFDGTAEEEDRERQEIQREFGGVGRLRRESVGPGGGEKGVHVSAGGRKWGFLGRAGSARRN